MKREALKNVRRVLRGLNDKLNALRPDDEPGWIEENGVREVEHSLLGYPALELEDIPNLLFGETLQEDVTLNYLATGEARSRCSKDNRILGTLKLIKMLAKAGMEICIYENADYVFVTRFPVRRVG
jgi:hypothetical protein